MRKRLASSRKTSGPYICSIIAFGAFPLRKPGSVIWLPTLRTARRIASADSSSSAVISSCTRLSGSRSIVNFTRARPLSVASPGGSSNRRAVSTGPTKMPAGRRRRRPQCSGNSPVVCQPASIADGTRVPIPGCGPVSAATAWPARLHAVCRPAVTRSVSISGSAVPLQRRDCTDSAEFQTGRAAALVP